MQVMGKTSTEESLKLENIVVKELPHVNKDSAFVSAKALIFTDEQLKSLENQKTNVLNGTELHSKMKTPVTVRNAKGDYEFTEFLSRYILHGGEYILWEVNEEEQQALFFQQVKDTPIYFNQKAMLKLDWNEEGEVINYEQHMLEKFVTFNHKKDLLSPIDALGSLFSRGHLKQDSKVINMKLGYSTLVQFTETQVFAPTWSVHVELKDGKIENYFINAIEGKVIEFQLEKKEEDIE